MAKHELSRIVKHGLIVRHGGPPLKPLANTKVLDFFLSGIY
jgi:hypothetical protein